MIFGASNSIKSVTLIIILYKVLIVTPNQLHHDKMHSDVLQTVGNTIYVPQLLY